MLCALYFYNRNCLKWQIYCIYTAPLQLSLHLQWPLILLFTHALTHLWWLLRRKALLASLEASEVQ